MIRRLSIIALLLGTTADADTMRMAVTTSFHNSGLADVLMPVLERDTGIEVQLLVVGTGQALRLGQAGDVEAVLVHSRQAEEDFVAAGHATHRREIMYNDFVLIGPADDPAAIAEAPDARSALEKIRDAQATFVSRGDDSGTHRKELSLWSKNTNDFGSWYREVGAGMGASLNTAAGLDAYILADRASWLNFGNKAGLRVLFSGDPALFNQYAYLPVNPARHLHVRADLSARVEDWLTSEAAQTLIDGYTIDGETLFVFNAKSAD